MSDKFHEVTDVTLFNSEGVLHTDFGSDVEVFIEVDFVLGLSCDFSIDVDAIGDVSTDANLTGKFGGGVVAIRADECWTSLDIPSGAFAKLSFITHVGLGHGTFEVRAGEASVVLDVHIRTCKGSASGHGESSSSCEYRFKHFS